MGVWGQNDSIFKGQFSLAVKIQTPNTPRDRDYNKDFNSQE